MSKILVNGKAQEIQNGETILALLKRVHGDSFVPHLCADPIIEPFGSCRLCSVEVKLAGQDSSRVVASCHTEASEGMEVTSHSPRVEQLRKGILELLIASYPAEQIEPRPNRAATPFQKLIKKYDVSESPYLSMARATYKSEDHPYIKLDLSQCVDCFKCIRVCDEVQGQFVLNRVGRGLSGYVSAGSDNQFNHSDCVSCGACVQICPTNALYDRFEGKIQISERKVQTTCTYCGVGCNLEVSLSNDKIQAISAVKDAPVNQGHLCLKGRYAFEYYDHPDRLRTPLIKKDGKLVEASWDEAYEFIVERFKETLNDSGPQAIGGLSSSRCTNEENYLMQKFIRAVVKSNNIDCCARVCHAPTAYGMRASYGTGAATNSIDEIPEAECLFVVGANPTDAHPVTGAKIKQRAMKGVPMIVIDPRKTELARHAKYHLQLKPGTNVALLNMMAHYILKHRAEDISFVENRTEGFEAYRENHLGLDMEKLAEITGVNKELVEEAALCFAKANRAMTFHGLGVTEHFQGSRTVMLLSSLVMLTGNIGKRGAGLNPLRGQNNVQGAADMGCQPNLAAGYMDYSLPEISAYYEEVYGSPVPLEKGLTTPEMFNAAIAGTLKAMWIMGEDVMQSDPDTKMIESALKSLDFLLVQEIFMTDTARLADVVLPASSFFEKEGTFTNGERRIQRVNQVVPRCEGTKPDGEIVTDIMQRMGFPQPDYRAQSVLTEICDVIPFFQGVTWEGLGKDGLQWPVLKNGVDSPMLHTTEFKHGKGRFFTFDYETSPELIGSGKEFPYILTTGRILEQYNSGTMTRRTPNRELSSEDVLLIHPEDAKRDNVTNGSFVFVESPRGKIRIRANISNEVNQGVLYTTFHYPETGVNKLTSCIMDRESKTPEYKIVAVRLSLN